MWGRIERPLPPFWKIYYSLFVKERLGGGVRCPLKSKPSPYFTAHETLSLNICSQLNTRNKTGARDSIYVGGLWMDPFMS